ncbi:uncharacterized protein N7496_009088 [Penicillium cataractarum]|uniref:Zn(2)-C6 fungal-type domain-containing protein n=1 Tax=Penicillium cataractarum TaxID=2100454 RepID=A0A9W9S4A2_9EURO|nr:uncharacterized protein N7496_009088 [Penicillium cataractarum]KAJ5369328.1 hypothetical protein N7496_009088 [Penicillium cataractarum]
MGTTKTLRTLLPAEDKHTMQSLEANPGKEMRRNVSLACTECQRKKTKCSGTAPCTRCATSAQQCLYDQTSDRRRKEYTVGLFKFHTTLCQLAATLRSAAPEELLSLVWQVQSLPTDQEAIDYLVQVLG